MFKKFLSVMTAIYIAAGCMIMFAGCGNVDAPIGNKPNTPDTKSETFYAYDAEAEEYDDEDYLTLTGTAVVWCFKDVAINETNFNGNVIFTGDKFTMTLEGSFSVLDTCTILYRGEKEGDGVLRIDSSVVTTYSDYIDKPIVVPGNEVMYYCKKGSKPENPVLPDDPDAENPPPQAPYTITISGNGGKFGADNTITRTTDEDGHIALNETPTREGYVFKGFNFKSDGSGEAVTSATVFDKNTIVYAVWVVEVTVTFMDGSTVFATKKVGKGDPLGDYRVPSANGKYFIGWYENDIKYASTTVVTDNITLTASWLTQEEMNERYNAYLQSLSTISLPGHVYIHYLRYDHDEEEEGTTNAAAPLYSTPIESKVYGDWALWAWSRAYDSNGRTFNAAWIDQSGAVYDIDTTYTFTDCGWDANNKSQSDKTAVFDSAIIGTQLFMLSSRQTQGFWANDGGDNYLSNLDKYNHVFLTQGNVRYPLYYSTVTGEITGDYRLPYDPYA
ncbi:MAG: InlB B-repeat-containing protein [Clostridiales bacterium]|nr:InlB B-repeat-containing protein [Clostridiales bacterium]